MSLEDEARSGRPLDATDEKVRDLVYPDRRIQVEELAQALSISHGSVSTISHDRLGMHKLTARWVPKSLSDEQMATRASVCSALLKRFRWKDDFLLRLTVDETWVHYYEPENKAQSRQWVGPGSSRPKKFKVAMDAVERNGYELIPHPAYSPDLAPSDFFLFPNLKKDVRGLHFRSDEEVVTAVEEWVNGKDPDFFSSGLMALEHRWSKCITLEGNYIEKEEVDLNRK